MAKAVVLTDRERVAREEDLRDYAGRLSDPMVDREKYDFRRGWEYCLGRLRLDAASRWTVGNDSEGRGDDGTRTGA